MRNFQIALAVSSILFWNCAQPAMAQRSRADTILSPERLSEQGWKSFGREWFYGVSQGSQIIRYDWWRALEQPKSQILFRQDSLTRFGYLPRPVTVHNADGLPVGFTIDSDRAGLWLGMNCAACHTSRLQYNGHIYQLDGAPGQGNFGAFISDLADALDETSSDPEKFNRFYGRIHKTDKEVSARQLRIDISNEAGAFRKFVTQSTPVDAWGPGRTDAFGMIFNRVTAIDMNRDDNSRIPNAPVSLPFLWTTSNQDRVQWNAMVDNATWYGRLARNVGQVLGVFGKLPGLHDSVAFHRLGMRNSVHTVNLRHVDKQIALLKPPHWIGPAIKPDDPVFVRGRDIYNARCAACHIDARSSQTIAASIRQWPCQTWPEQSLHLPAGIFPICTTAVSDVGTDKGMAENIVRYTAQTGVLNGYSPPLSKLAPLGQSAKGGEILRYVVIGAILDGKPIPENSPIATLPLPPGGTTSGNKLKADFKRTVEVGAASDIYIPNGQDLATLQYKGGPLNGIWATGPYLHNGSVPTLSDLLKPVADRPVIFEIGSRDFDADHVGFVSSAGSGNFPFDTRKPGNSNAGHIYGTDLGPSDRDALLLYLKTL